MATEPKLYLEVLHNLSEKLHHDSIMLNNKGIQFDLNDYVIEACTSIKLQTFLQTTN